MAFGASERPRDQGRERDRERMAHSQCDAGDAAVKMSSIIANLRKVYSLSFRSTSTTNVLLIIIISRHRGIVGMIRVVTWPHEVVHGDDDDRLSPRWMSLSM